jgi:glyoxylase-like metal-dependent hydrolase (beta-lactamase superfamily II)
MPDFRSEPPQIICHILDTGYCLAHEHILIQGGARKEVACHSIVALLGHPQHGWLLWDAGYAPHMLTATAHFPYSLYRLATPLRLRPELAAAAQLGRFGLTPHDIRAVIISHFHADHLAGLRDFPASLFVALPEAYASVAKASGLKALRKAFIPSLLPPDFGARLSLPGAYAAPSDRSQSFFGYTKTAPWGEGRGEVARSAPAFGGEPLPGLGPTHDLFGDGSLVLVRLPGHARGQMGLLACTDKGPIFFVADSCWLAQSVRKNRGPSAVGNLIADNAGAAAATIAALHTFAQARPDVLIVPSHCPETFAQLTAN